MWLYRKVRLDWVLISSFLLADFSFTLNYCVIWFGLLSCFFLNCFCAPEERNNSIHFCVNWNVFSHCLDMFEYSSHYIFVQATLRWLTLVGVSGDERLNGKHNSFWNRWKMNRAKHVILFASWFATLSLPLIFCRDIPFLLSPDIRRAFSVSFSCIFSLYVSCKNERNGAHGSWAS